MISPNLLRDLIVHIWSSILILFLYCHVSAKRGFLRKCPFKMLFFFCFFSLYIFIANFLERSYGYMAADLILFMALILMDYKESERMLEIEKRLKLQIEYTKNIEDINNAIRKEKHEFVNHLNVINALCSANTNSDSTVEKIMTYTGRLLESTGCTARVFNSGNSYVDSLLAIKYNHASQNGIHMDADFDASFGELEISDIDITSIVGNIIDNSFDALKSLKEGTAISSIYTYSEGNKFYISFSNNGEAIPPQTVKKIFLEKFSTKKKKDGQHGYGLYITKKLVEKYGGTISVTSSESLTEFLISFPLQKNTKAAAESN